MTYQVNLSSAAKRQLKKLSPTLQDTLKRLIDSLATDPRPSGCKKLKGRNNEYRIRTGNYRILYVIKDDALIVTVIKLGHRRDAYD